MADVFGCEVTNLPDGAVALEVVVLVKALNVEGDLMLCEKRSDGLTAWEALGMATTYADGLRRWLMQCSSEVEGD